MPDKDLASKSSVALDPTERVALGLGVPADDAITQTQLKFNVGALVDGTEEGVLYVTAKIPADPVAQNHISDDFNVDWMIRGTLDEMALVDVTINPKAKNYSVRNANAQWLGSFDLPTGNAYLQAQITAARVREPNQSIVFLVCIGTPKHYEYCELKPLPSGQWQLINSNPTDKKWNTKDYQAEASTKPNADLNSLIAEIQVAGFTLSNVTSHCVFEQGSTNGSGVAAVETVIDRLVRASNKPIHERPYVDMNAMVRNDIPNQPDISMDQKIRQRHAAIIIKLAENNADLKTDLQAKIATDPIEMPLYLACYDDTDIATRKRLLPPVQMIAPYSDAYIKELKNITTFDTRLARAAQLQTTDFTWNMRVNEQAIRTALEDKLPERLKTQITVDAETADKKHGLSARDTKNYVIKSNGKPLMEVTKNALASSENWKEGITEGTNDDEKTDLMAHALLTAFLTVCSKPLKDKKIDLSGSDTALCEKIEQLANTHPDFQAYNLKINSSAHEPIVSATQGFGAGAGSSPDPAGGHRVAP